MYNSEALHGYGSDGARFLSSQVDACAIVLHSTGTTVTETEVSSWPKSDCWSDRAARWFAPRQTFLTSRSYKALAASTSEKISLLSWSCDIIWKGRWVVLITVMIMVCSDQADFSHHQCQRARVQSLSGEVSFHNNNNNNEVFERSFSIEPKAHTANNQTKRRKVPDTKYSHAAHTNVSLTSPSLHLHTHTHTRTCTHTCTHTHTHMFTYAHTWMHAHTHTRTHMSQITQSMFKRA